MKHIYSLLLLSAVFITSCNAQDKTPLLQNTAGEAPFLPAGQSKMIRTQGMQYGNVGSGLLDKNGNLWFGTSGEGVYRYDGKSFTNFTTKDGLIDNNVSGIIEDKAGNILIATGSGICRYDGESFTDVVTIQSITSLLEDREGNLWFGTMNNGVYRYDGKSFANFLNNDDHQFNLGNHYQLILDILQDNNGDIWFSSWNRGGVWRYDGKSFTNYLPSADYYQPKDSLDSYKKSYTVYQPAGQSHTNISDDMIFSLSEDKAGNIWFATRDHGACRYDGTSFTSLWKKEGFTSRGAYSILEDKNGNLWFTTDKDGVWRYDGKSFTNFTTKDGLINNSVFSVVEDRAGNLWFGTRGFGLSRYDGKSFTSFSE